MSHSKFNTMQLKEKKKSLETDFYLMKLCLYTVSSLYPWYMGYALISCGGYVVPRMCACTCVCRSMRLWGRMRTDLYEFKKFLDSVYKNSTHEMGRKLVFFPWKLFILTVQISKIAILACFFFAYFCICIFFPT